MIKPYWWRPLALDNNLHKVQQLKPWIVLQKFNKGFTNFGDELNQLILFDLFEAGNAKRSTLSETNFFFIGSILELTQRTKSETLHVLGSGIRNANSFNLPRNVHAHAFRGKLTAKYISGKGSDVLGDPALILSRFRPANLPSKSSVKVFAPHFSLFATQHYMEVLQLFQDREFQILWPNSDTKEALSLIASSDFLVSSALHPLIVADAFGIPAIYFEDQSPFESRFKYEDYCSIFDGGNFWPSINLRNFCSEKDMSAQLVEQSSQRVFEIEETILQISGDLIKLVERVKKDYLL